MYILGYYWYICIIYRDKGLGLEGVLKVIKCLFYGWVNWDLDNLGYLIKL